MLCSWPHRPIKWIWFGDPYVATRSPNSLTVWNTCVWRHLVAHFSHLISRAVWFQMLNCTVIVPACVDACLCVCLCVGVPDMWNSRWTRNRKPHPSWAEEEERLPDRIGVQTLPNRWTQTGDAGVCMYIIYHIYVWFFHVWKYFISWMNSCLDHLFFFMWKLHPRLLLYMLYLSAFVEAIPVVMLIYIHLLQAFCCCSHFESVLNVITIPLWLVLDSIAKLQDLGCDLGLETHLWWIASVLRCQICPVSWGRCGSTGSNSRWHFAANWQQEAPVRINAGMVSPKPGEEETCSRKTLSPTNHKLV